MNVSNFSSVGRCGPVSLNGILPSLNAMGVILSIATCLLYLLGCPVIIFSRQDSVRKMNSLLVTVFGILMGVFVLPLNMIALSIKTESKTLKMCLATQGLQLMFEAEFIGNLTIFFFVPVLILSNPLRQSFFQSTRGKILVGNIVWVVVALLTTIPLIIVVLTAPDRNVACCGWHLFPDPFVYGLIYGLILPIVAVGFWSSVRMVHLARRKAVETAVPVRQPIEQSSIVRAASDKRNRVQCRWLFVALFHFTIGFAPVIAMVSYYLSCPFCINSELTHFVLNAMTVAAALMLSLSNYTFKENREVFKQLYFRCAWKNARIEAFWSMFCYLWCKLIRSFVAASVHTKQCTCMSKYMGDCP